MSEMIDHLRMMNLKQEPPRKRTMLCRGFGDPEPFLRSFSFPWLSIGGLVQKMDPMDPLSRSLIPRVFVFGHDRPWENLDEAPVVLRGLTAQFHSGATGLVCVGYVNPKKVSPQEAFWMTTSYWDGRGRDRNCLLDTKSLQVVGPNFDHLLTLITLMNGELMPWPPPS